MNSKFFVSLLSAAALCSCLPQEEQVAKDINTDNYFQLLVAPRTTNNISRTINDTLQNNQNISAFSAQPVTNQTYNCSDEANSGLLTFQSEGSGLFSIEFVECRTEEGYLDGKISGTYISGADSEQLIFSSEEIVAADQFGTRVRLTGLNMDILFNRTPGDNYIAMSHSGTYSIDGRLFGGTVSSATQSTLIYRSADSCEGEQMYRDEFGNVLALQRTGTGIDARLNDRIVRQFNCLWDDR